MLIHVAQNGKKFELDCQASTSVDVVQKALATLMGVPPAEQMLICADLRLEPSRTLGHYGLPAEDKHVFLFNRSSLVADAPIPEADLVDDVELELPEEPSRLEIGHPLDESPNPLLRALPSYERQFRYHYQKAQAIWRGSQQRYDLCRQLSAEMDVQAMAIQTARGNMDIYYSHMKQRYDEFTRSCQEQHRKHSDILANFERDMERLRNTELHPVLKTESRSTLLDCLNDQGIRKWADDCATSHTHFEAKVGELRAQFTGLQRNVEDLKMTEPDVDLEYIEDQMEEHQAAVDEQASILQSLSKDLNTVKKLVEDCVSGQLTSSLRPLDAVAALDPMSELHISSHLPTVEHNDSRLSNLVAHMNKCKVAMTRCVHTQLQSVAALQRRIRDMRNQLVGYREAMQRQE